MISILINGAKGRMGQAVANAAQESGVAIAGAVDVGDDIAAAMARAGRGFRLINRTRAALHAAISPERP